MTEDIEPTPDSVGVSRNEAPLLDWINIITPIINKGRLQYDYKQGSLMNNYNRLPSWPIVRRSYELPTQLYFMTFKPFNKNYKSEMDCMDQIRKKIGTGHLAVIITREINAAKIHYNAMVFTNKQDFDTQNHDKHTSRHKIYCVKVKMADKYRVHDYIIKESQTRYFYSQRSNWHKQDIYTK